MLLCMKDWIIRKDFFINDRVKRDVINDVENDDEDVERKEDMLEKKGDIMDDEEDELSPENDERNRSKLKSFRERDNGHKRDKPGEILSLIVL